MNNQSQTKPIVDHLINGGQYENEAANWYTLSKPSDNRRIIVINDEFKFYKNIESYAKRILTLMKRGY